MELIILKVSNNSDSEREYLASEIETSVKVTSPISNCSLVSSNCLFNTSTFFSFTLIFEFSVAKSAYNFIASKKTSCSTFFKELLCEKISFLATFIWLKLLPPSKIL